MRVDLTGRPLDAAPLVLGSADVNPGPRQVACTAAQCLVVSGGLDYQRLSSDGRLLDATPQHLAEPASLNESALVTALADRYVVTWGQVPTASTSDVLVARIDLDGRVLDPGGRPVTAAGSERRSPSIATDGTRLFLVFRASAAGSRPAGIYTLLLDAALNPLAPLSVITETTFGNGERPFWDGTQWVVATNDYLVRFSSAGVRLDAAPRAVVRSNPMALTLEVVGPAPGGFLALEYGTTIEPEPFRGSFVRGVQRHTSDGAPVGANSPLPIAIQNVTRPRVDSDGDEFLSAVYAEPFPDWPRLARVSASGAVRDVPSRLSSQAMIAPALLLEGPTALLFGTVPGHGLSAFSLDLSTGAASSPIPLDASPSFGVAVRGPDQRLLFAATTNGAPGYVARFRPTGARLDLAGTPLPGMRSIAADFDGARYLYVYPALVSGQWQAFARRVDTAGDFVDLSPRSLEALGPLQAGPGMAFGGGTHLLAWIDPSLQVRAARLGADGAPAASTALSLGSAGAAPVYTDYERDREVQVVFDGTNFVVLWLHGADLRVRAVRVTPAGAALDATPFVLSGGGLDAPAAPLFAAASDGRGSTLVLHEVFDHALGAIQVRGVFLREDGAVVPDGGVVAVDAGTDAPAVMDVLRDAGSPADVVDVVIADAAVVDVALDAGTDVVDVPVVDAGDVVDTASDRPGPGDVAASADDGAADAGAAVPPEGGLCSVRGGVGASPRGGLPVGLLLLGLVGLRRRRHLAA
jgi:hypothetical protein